MLRTPDNDTWKPFRVGDGQGLKKLQLVEHVAISTRMQMFTNAVHTWKIVSSSKQTKDLVMKIKLMMKMKVSWI